MSETKPSYPNPFLWVPSSYLAMGLIYVTVGSVANVMFKNMGMDNTNAAFWSSILGFPYTFKFLWAPLLDRLHAAGIPVEGITILIATGLHRQATKEEIQEIVGPEIARAYRVVSHDARLLAQHPGKGLGLHHQWVCRDQEMAQLPGE